MGGEPAHLVVREDPAKKLRVPGTEVTVVTDPSRLREDIVRGKKISVTRSLTGLDDADILRLVEGYA